MSLVLTKRIPNGAPLTASQHDANLTAIEGAVNTDAANLLNYARLDQFEGLVSGKETIDWVNVINKPAAGKVYPFRAANGGTQSIAVTTSGSAHLDIGTSINDPDAVFNPGSGVFTCPINGFYQFNWSVGVGLASGTPTGISIICSLRQNTSGQNAMTFPDDAATGERIYNGSILLLLSVGDTVDLSFECTQVGTGTWDVTGAALSGFLVKAT